MLDTGSSSEAGQPINCKNMERPSRITSPESSLPPTRRYLCVSPASTNDYIWALCALSHVVNAIDHACDQLLRWYRLYSYQSSWLRRRAFSSGTLAKGLFLLRSFECEAAANFHQFAVEHETEACDGDLARGLFGISRREGERGRR